MDTKQTDLLKEIQDNGRILAEKLIQNKQMLAIAESCTGGMLGKFLTDMAGSSAWFERGIISYSNQAKQELLGVDKAIIQNHGAVSQPTVEAMAQGLLKAAPVDYTIAITGIAGPSGGSALKPIGTVWIGWADKNKIISNQYCFDGDREMVRLQAVFQAIKGLLDFI